MPGATNPDIIDYAGPIDPQVGVIGAWDMSGKLIGSIVNFSCHATTNPGGISANWIYYMERAIQGALDSRAPVVFLAGACGDIGQVDSLSPYEVRTGEAWAQFIGGRVGAEAVKVLLSVPRGTDVPLNTRRKIWSIQRRAPIAGDHCQGPRNHRARQASAGSERLAFRARNSDAHAPARSRAGGGSGGAGDADRTRGLSSAIPPNISSSTDSRSRNAARSPSPLSSSSQMAASVTYRRRKRSAQRRRLRNATHVLQQPGDRRRPPNRRSVHRAR